MSLDANGFEWILTSKRSLDERLSEGDAQRNLDEQIPPCPIRFEELRGHFINDRAIVALQLPAKRVGHRSFNRIADDWFTAGGQENRFQLGEIGKRLTTGPIYPKCRGFRVPYSCFSGVVVALDSLPRA